MRFDNELFVLVFFALGKNSGPELLPPSTLSRADHFLVSFFGTAPCGFIENFTSRDENSNFMILTIIFVVLIQELFKNSIRVKFISTFDLVNLFVINCRFMKHNAIFGNAILGAKIGPLSMIFNA